MRYETWWHGNRTTSVLACPNRRPRRRKFAERLLPLGLTPPNAGILRMLRIASGISQQELAARLQIHPSRLVAILDNLEHRELVERKPNSEDRQLYSLFLTKDGAEMLDRIGQLAREHQGQSSRRPERRGTRGAGRIVAENRRRAAGLRMAFTPAISGLEDLKAQ